MAAFLTAKHDGDARAAKEEMQQKNAHLLGPNHDLPSLRFFKRQATKICPPISIGRNLLYTSSFYRSLVCYKIQWAHRDLVRKSAMGATASTVKYGLMFFTRCMGLMINMKKVCLLQKMLIVG